MLNKYYYPILLIISIVLTGCVTPKVNVRVKTFNNWTQYTAATFKIDAATNSTLENQFYNEKIIHQLQDIGMIQHNKQARYTVKPQFLVEARQHQYNIPLYRESGFWTAATYYEHDGKVYYRPSFWVNSGIEFYGYQNKVETVFYHILKLDIYEKDVKRYESTAILPSYKNNMLELHPYLIRAIFETFPNQNGKIQRYQYELNEN